MPNALSPFGLRPVRNLISGSNTYQASIRRILGTYATTIGFGDVVSINPGGAGQGYTILAPDGAASTLGVFQGVLPYYSTTISQTVNASGWVADAGAPTFVECMVVDDPNIVFQAQLSGAFTWSMVGQNIDWTAATNGAPGAAPSRISTLSLDVTTVGVANTLPFKILGLASTFPGGIDPTDTNPWLEVKLNTAQLASSGGI